MYLQVTIWTGDEGKDPLSAFEVFRKVAHDSRLLRYNEDMT
jgi:hypothetical protein